MAGLLAVLFLATFHIKRGDTATMLPRGDSNLLLDVTALGVRRYSIPGELGSGTNCSLQGTLHIYLKALRWPVSWLRACLTADEQQPLRWRSPTAAALLCIAIADGGRVAPPVAERLCGV